MTQKTQSTPQIDSVTAFLTEKGVKVKDLTIVYYGADAVIGEIAEADFFADYESLPKELIVKNPKRILRIQQQTPEGFMFTFALMDFDFIKEGFVTIRPTVVARVLDQSLETQDGILQSYADFLKRRAVERAAEAGLALPKSPIISPFKK